MAKPIRNTPILYGKDAKQFLAEIENLPSSEEQHAALRKIGQHHRADGIHAPAGVIFQPFHQIPLRQIGRRARITHTVQLSNLLFRNIAADPKHFVHAHF